MLSEQEVRGWIYARLQEGERNRRMGRINNHGGNSLSHMLVSYGWVKEDLRLALIKSNESYALGQLSNPRKDLEVGGLVEVCQSFGIAREHRWVKAMIIGIDENGVQVEFTSGNRAWVEKQHVRVK